MYATQTSFRPLGHESRRSNSLVTIERTFDLWRSRTGAASSVIRRGREARDRQLQQEQASFGDRNRDTRLAVV
jgi:hypothetical protein